MGNCTTACRKGSQHSPFWFLSSLKPRFFLSSLSTLPADVTPNQSVDIVQPRLPTSVCLLTIVNHHFRHVSHGELTLNYPTTNTRDGFRVVWDLFWRLDLNLSSERCSQMLLGRGNCIQIVAHMGSQHFHVKPLLERRRRCQVLQIVTTSVSG